MSRWQTVTRPDDGDPLDEGHLRVMLAQLGEQAPPRRNTGRRSRLVVRACSLSVKLSDSEGHFTRRQKPPVRAL